MGRVHRLGQRLGRLALVSSMAAVAILLGAGTVLAAPSPADGMDIESECPPWPARFEPTWETVDAASGQARRRFGTINWSRSGLNFEIRNGFAVQMCLSSIDAGMSFGVTTQVRGPEVGRVPHEDLTGVGFGFVVVPLVPAEVPAGIRGVEQLPSTGADATGWSAAAVGMLAVGGVIWHATRKRSRPGRP